MHCLSVMERSERQLGSELTELIGNQCRFDAIFSLSKTYVCVYVRGDSTYRLCKQH